MRTFRLSAQLSVVIVAHLLLAAGDPVSAAECVSSARVATCTSMPVCDQIGVGDLSQTKGTSRDASSKDWHDGMPGMPLSPGDCDLAAVSRSLASITPTQITFVNGDPGLVTLLWLDFSGRPVLYGTLVPGESLAQPTFLTHPWMVLDQKNECLGVYFPKREAGVARIVRTNGSHPVSASPAIQALVRQAIEERFRAADIPDIQMLPANGPVLVRQEMDGLPGQGLAASALPTGFGREFRLIQESAAQAEANEKGEAVTFIVVRNVTIDDRDAVVTLGVDYVERRLLQQPLKMCCCTGDATYRRVERRWEFVGWRNRICI